MVPRGSRRSRGVESTTAPLASVSLLALARGPQSGLLLLHVGRQGVAEILRAEDGAELDLFAVLERAAADPLHGLIDRLHLPGPEAGHELLGLGERAVDHGSL